MYEVVALYGISNWDSETMDSLWNLNLIRFNADFLKVVRFSFPAPVAGKHV